jgi:hypothetical protein
MRGMHLSSLPARMTDGFTVNIDTFRRTDILTFYMEGSLYAICRIYIFNTSKRSRNCIHYLLQHKLYVFCLVVYLYAPYRSRNKQRLFP